MITIGIQGGKGSFSEEAALQFADNHGLKKITNPEKWERYGKFFTKYFLKIIYIFYVMN